MTNNPKTYKQASMRPSRKVWPGCGDGRKRWCGRIHDFIRTTPNGVVHNFECRKNHYYGCPQPIPDPGKSYGEWLEDECKEEVKNGQTQS